MSDDEKNSDNSAIFFLLEDDKKQGKQPDSSEPAILKLGDIGEDFNIELDFQKFGIVDDERRQQKRFAYWGKVFIHDKQTQKTIPATVKDLNKKGIGLTLPTDSIEVGKEVTIEFTGSSSLKPLTVNATVANVQKRDGRFFVGFEVTGMSQLTRKKIQEFIDEFIEARGFSDSEVP